MIIFPINAAASHIYPILPERDIREQKDRTFWLVTLLVFSFSIPVFFAMAMHASAVLSLLGSNFEDGAIVLIIVSAGRLIRNGLGNTAFVLVLRGYQRIEIVNAAAGAASKVGLSLALIPIFGILGAGVSSTLMELILNVVRARQTRLRLGIRIPWELLFRLSTTGAVASLFVAGLEQFARTDEAINLPALLGRIGGGAVVILMACLLLGLKGADRGLLMNAIRRSSLPLGGQHLT
jgi:O-antigen/teichoic acid export membrane protein